MDQRDLAARVERLEAIEAIRALKARYLNACDRKDVAAIRDCLVASGAAVDYGPVGRFEGREAFVETFERLACRPGVVDVHLGGNPEIEVVGPDRARARWALYFFTMIEDASVVRQLGGTYDDTYRREGGAWRIESTTFRAHSILDGEIVAGVGIRWKPGGSAPGHPGA